MFNCPLSKFHPMKAASGKDRTWGWGGGIHTHDEDTERHPLPSHALVTYQEFSTKKNQALMTVISEPAMVSEQTSDKVFKMTELRRHTEGSY